MKTMMTSDRITMTNPTMGSNQGLMTAMPMNMMMIPRCTMKLAKCTDGMTMTCATDDPMAVSMLQNLCDTMPGSMMSCYTMINGMVMACCNMTMGMCKCQKTKDGVTFSCMSGDTQSCQIIQACCDCMTTMMQSGCSCCVCLNNVPVCCGTI